VKGAGEHSYALTEKKGSKKAVIGATFLKNNSNFFFHIRGVDKKSQEWINTLDFELPNGSSSAYHRYTRM